MPDKNCHNLNYYLHQKNQIVLYVLYVTLFFNLPPLDSQSAQKVIVFVRFVWLTKTKTGLQNAFSVKLNMNRI